MSDIKELMRVIDYLKLEAKKNPNFILNEVGKDFKANISDFNKLLDVLDVNKNSKDKAKKGKALEDVVKFIFSNYPIFSIRTNIHTSTNEIDDIIILNDLGIQLGETIAPITNEFLCECKNYKSKIDVTWVGKFVSLLSAHNCIFGIIFSYHPLKGRKWDSAHGLVRKFYLKSDRIILNFCRDDFEEIKRIGFLELLQLKYRSLKFDTDFEKEITQHPAQIIK